MAGSLSKPEDVFHALPPDSGRSDVLFDAAFNLSQTGSDVFRRASQPAQRWGGIESESLLHGSVKTVRKREAVPVPGDLFMYWGVVGVLVSCSRLNVMDQTSWKTNVSGPNPRLVGPFTAHGISPSFRSPRVHGHALNQEHSETWAEV